MVGLGHVIVCSPYIVVTSEFSYFAVNLPTWQKEHCQKMLVRHDLASRSQGTMYFTKDGVFEVEVEFCA